jgi:hypothetical protein
MQILRTLARFLNSDEGDGKRLRATAIPPSHPKTNASSFRDQGDRVEVTRVRNRREAYR